MKTLSSYFENESDQLQALRNYFIAWGDRRWLVREMSLYNASRDAFHSELAPQKAMREFEEIDSQLTGYWQVFRPYPREACWPPEKIHETIKRQFNEFSWSGPITLLNFLKSGSGLRLQVSLETMRGIKPNQGYPIMTVSKFLHFYNPALFPIYDEKVVWGKVFRRFGNEFRGFCDTTAGIRWNNDYTPLWFHNYTCWASFLMSNAHVKFMQVFVDWLDAELEGLKKQLGTYLPTRKYDPATLYARAFEFTATGAAVIESGEARTPSAARAN